MEKGCQPVHILYKCRIITVSGHNGLLDSHPDTACHTARPETGGYRKSHSQPGYTTLVLYPYLVCLNLSRVSGLVNQMFFMLLLTLNMVYDVSKFKKMF